jgi:hypothetical protein
MEYYIKIFGKVRVKKKLYRTIRTTRSYPKNKQNTQPARKTIKASHNTKARGSPNDKPHQSY